ncbi:MAG: complement resistance protein TraT [Lentisphaeria bacterium]|nr:complement resistance protein TraT [Lentisphaeria bacterium]MDP7742219.1 complement resistance protein TraT [Lentisphaeria bacterium]
MYRTAVAIAAMALMTGCVTMDSAYEGTTRTTNPDAMKVQTDIRWTGRQPRIRPAPAEDKFVYFTARSSAGVDVELRPAIEQQLERRGYRLTPNIDEAQFVLDADLRHFGEQRTRRNTGAVTGAIIGGAAGGVTGNNVKEFDRNAGAVGGAILGGAIGHVLDNRNKMVEIKLIVDVTIGERLRDGTWTGEATASHSGSVGRGSHTGDKYDENGRYESESSEDHSAELSDGFLYHNNQVVASARKMKLTMYEAEPLLTARLSRAIASVLP